MNILLLTAAIVSAFFAVIMTTLFVRYKIQIKDLRKQINFIKENETNLELTTSMNAVEIHDLVANINEILKYQKEVRKSELRMNHIFRETITNISHDIRTPLTSAMGYVQMLTNSEITEEKKIEYIKVINHRIQAVNKLLNQLFEYARLEADEIKLDKKEINLNNVLRDTLSLFYDDFVGRNIMPDIDIPDQKYIILGDEDALARIFENIISNALKHSAEQFSVRSLCDQKGCKIEFSNRTDAVTEEDIESIFDRFYTTDKSRTKKTTGLGLSIAKKLVMMMDGNICANYKQGIFSIIITF